MDEEAELNWTK